MKTISEIIDIINSTNPRSAWNRGVKLYALDILVCLPSNVDYGSVEAMLEDALNGARNWDQFSWGGCSMIYNCDIARRLCSPSELKKVRDGERRPNAREEWLDTQARALRQAWMQIDRVSRGMAPLF